MNKVKDISVNRNEKDEVKKIWCDNLMKLRLVKIILMFFLLMPIVESSNGYFYGQGISDIYRFLLLLLIVYYFLRYGEYLSSNIFKFMFIVCTFLVLVLFQFFLLHKNQSIFFSDIKSTFRILLAPIYFVFFYESIRSNTLRREELKKIILGYSLLYSLLIIIPYLQGNGYVSYNLEGNGLKAKMSEVQGVGSKGYFIELNSLVAILSACAFFLKNMIINFNNKKRYIRCLMVVGIYLLVSISLCITATKLGILFVVLCNGLLILQIFRCQITFGYKVGIVLTICLVIYSGYVFLGDIIEKAFTRLQYYYSQSNGDILNVITSNRFNYLIESARQIDNSNHWLFIHLFGAGYYTSFILDGTKRSIVEMDWFDLYFTYGIVGFTTYLYFFKNAFISCFFSKNNEMKSMMVVFIVYSFLGGHIIVNSMTTTFLAICLVYSSDA